MRLRVHGGVGEKGRTCVALERDGRRIVIDVGVDTSVPRGPDHYPAISPRMLAATEAILVTHAHEDHVGALGWAHVNGFSGRVLMTAETADEFGATLAAYATAGETAAARAARIELIEPGRPFELGPFSVRAGRSGHVVGGVWAHFTAGGRRLLYCGDVVPASPVFAMDPLEPCDLLVVDASYGADRTSAAERGRAVLGWLADHPRGAVLPTPLSGRSLELLALIDAPIAIPAAMRPALERQLAAGKWLVPGAAELIAGRLARAAVWREGDRLPAAALICDDGMGVSGPSRAALARARESGHPVLLTGHMPKGSPAEAMFRAGEADWLRFPTHPTMQENAELAAATGAAVVIAHSCDIETARSMRGAISGLNADPRPGDAIDV